MKITVLFLMLLPGLVMAEFKGLCQHLACHKSCEELSDSFCEYLWSDDVLGNFAFDENQKVLIGKTEDRLISHAQLIDLRALVINKCKLPRELKSILKVDCSNESPKDWFIQLKNHLDYREKQSISDHFIRKKWLWKIADLNTHLNRSINFAANKRTFSKHPELKEKIWEDLSDYERKIFMQDLFDIKTEVLNAKYLDHPNYKNVQKIFIEAKEDIYQNILKMNINASIKNHMLQKIKSVKLSLPYEDPRLVGAKEDCGTVDQNAYYIGSKNIFTVCAGYFNVYQVDGHIFRVVAHEISHSIDPQQLSHDQFRLTSLSQLVGEVYSLNARMSCKDWQERQVKVFVNPSDFFNLPKQIGNLNQCLVEQKELNILTMDSLNVPTQMYTSNKFHGYALRKMFSKLAQPEIFKKGKLIQNQYFLDPLLLEAATNNYIEKDYYRNGFFHIGSVFVQNLICELQNIYPEVTDGNFTSHKIPADLFENSINKTEEMYKVYKKTLFSFVGRNDQYLQYHELAQPIDEAWADWMASKAMTKKLKRINSLEEKRIFALATQAKFCRQDGMERLSASKLTIEKTYSKEVHPLQRNRRLSYFLPEFVESLDCKPGPEILKLSQSCHDMLKTEDLLFESENPDAESREGDQKVEPSL